MSITAIVSTLLVDILSTSSPLPKLTRILESGPRVLPDIVPTARRQLHQNVQRPQTADLLRHEGLKRNDLVPLGDVDFVDHFEGDDEGRELLPLDRGERQRERIGRVLSESQDVPNGRVPIGLPELPLENLFVLLFICRCAPYALIAKLAVRRDLLAHRQTAQEPRHDHDGRLLRQQDVQRARRNHQVLSRGNVYVDEGGEVCEELRTGGDRVRRVLPVEGEEISAHHTRRDEQNRVGDAVQKPAVVHATGG